MTLTLKTAKRALMAAGYSEAEVSELVRGIKADAWDKGSDATTRAHFSSGDRKPPVNPYRSNESEPA